MSEGERERAVQAATDPERKQIDHRLLAKRQARAGAPLHVYAGAHVRSFVLMFQNVL